jgi:hypothetical protein
MSAFEKRTQKREYKDAFEANPINQVFLSTMASSAQAQAQDTPRKFHTDDVIWLTTKEEAANIPTYTPPNIINGTKSN